MKRRIVIGISGATGAVYGVRVLEVLRAVADIETHLVVSAAAHLTLASELDMKRAAVDALADFVHNDRDIGASIASGSFATSGMIIAPCSMKSLAAIATGVADTLIARAADVVLKERRRLVLLARETPLNLVHLRNMTTVTEMGAIVCPPMPGFYSQPKTIDDLVDQTVGRALELLDVDAGLVRQWPGIREQISGS